VRRIFHQRERAGKNLFAFTDLHFATVVEFKSGYVEVIKQFVFALPLACTISPHLVG
jgi:hypothetical protein